MQTLTNKLFGIFNLFRRRGSSSPPAPAANVTSTASTLSFTERREAPRRWGDPIQVLIWDEDPANPSARGWILNRSAGGLGLSWAQPVLEGTLLSVRVANAPESVPWTRLQVKGCTPATGRWMLSCQFIETPPQEVLLMFR
jgi:hypothetical protein